MKHIFVALGTLFLSLNLAVAQELDPTVVVNKAYEGKLIQVHKPTFDMVVPDSVTRFALDFDYLVFDQPYKGADSFTPYILTMKPASMARESRKIYLEAGAGYTLHPTLDFVWTPLRSKVFQMDVYAKHRSYVGDYHSFIPSSESQDVIKVDRWRDADGGKKGWKGYDFLSEAGVDGRFEWASLSAGFDVSYYGLASKDLEKKRMYDALDVKLGVSSKPKNGSYFKYDVLAAYRFAEDKLQYFDYGRDYVGEHVVDFDAMFGRVMTGGHQVMLDVDADVAIYSPTAVGQLSFTPRYLLKRNRWNVDAGVRISAMIRSKEYPDFFSARTQVVYPAVKASYDVIRDAMRVYAGIGGGNKLNTYASLLERNHHVDTRFGVGATGLMNLTIERVSASLGVEGRIGSTFSYDLHAGYVNYASDVLDAVLITTDPVSGSQMYLPGLGYAAYQKCFVAASWLMNTDRIRFDGQVNYTYAWGLKNNTGLFMPAALTGDVSFEYNWSKRIFAGIDCDFSTGRHGGVWIKIPGGPGVEKAVIPGYVDLGVNFEYAISRSLSVWARGGNLLNMTIQRNPLYAEKGLSATVGICLNL